MTSSNTKPETVFTGVNAPADSSGNLRHFHNGTATPEYIDDIESLCVTYDRDFDTITVPEIVNMLAWEAGLSGDDGRGYMIMPNGEFAYVE